MSDSRERLLDVVLMLVEDMHPSRIEKMASLIRDMNAEKRVGSYDWGGIVPREQEQALLDGWRATDVTPEELAGMLIGAGHAYHAGRSEVSVQLVWTGPMTELIPMRRTEQVLLELIRAAKKSVFLVSFVAHGVPTIESALRDAIARNVTVSILVERGKEHGGTLSFDPVEPLKESMPGAAIYVWSPENREVDDAGRYGSVHAKCAVADARIAFVTSANLTGAALEKNMELGLLVTGGRIPPSIQRHLEALIMTKQIVHV